MEQACLAVIHLSYMTSTVYLKTAPVYQHRGISTGTMLVV